jgi:hypothetical protein
MMYEDEEDDDGARNDGQDYQEDDYGDSLSLDGPQSDSCIWSTLTGLCYINEPQEAMRQFCGGILGLDQKWVAKYSRGREFEEPRYNLYVFSGPVGEDSNTEDNVDYAPRFAQFIRENKLGIVAYGPIVENTKFHVGRPGQVFIWAPDDKALKAWYKELTRPKVEPPPVVQPVLATQVVKKVGRRRKGA